MANYDLVTRSVMWAWDRWKATPLATIFSWVEVCWGFWIMSNPPNGTSQIIYQAGETVFGWVGGHHGGLIVGALFAAHGAARWAIEWHGRLLGWAVLSHLTSLFTFWLMVWATALAQGWTSPLVIMYIGFEAANTYLLGCSLADLDAARERMPKIRGTGRCA